MTKINTFDHIFQEVEHGHNLNTTLTEVNFWLKIVEFYYVVFHELLNTPFRRNGNMKKFITLFLWSFHKFLQQTFSNMPWIKLMKDILKPFVCSHQFFYSCMSLSRWPIRVDPWHSKYLKYNEWRLLSPLQLSL